MNSDSIILVLSSLGIAQAIFLCGYLFTLRKGNRAANVFLGIIILALTIRIGKSIFHNYTAVDPRIRNLAISTILLVGPFLWFYGKALFEKKNGFSKTDYYHLVPFILYAVCSPIIPNRGDFASSIAYASVFVHLATYLAFCWYRLYHQKSEHNKALFRWYFQIVLGITIMWFLYVSIFARLIPFYILGAISFSFLMYVFSFLLLKKHVFVLEKYKGSTLNVDQSKNIITRLKLLLESSDSLSKEEISLDQIALKLKVSNRELSQAINQNEQKNFSEFINHYRIKKAKALLSSQEYITEKIATIAYDCGFGNVTSFNLAFKAETGLTPSAYRKKMS
ncbi:AraC family transcriptional regulator [Spongiivirga sp. MCCC 1A20706]|uniref:helix-turn-helix domain-containing protein n=1 Tax=Spongiivirga sp. MCCC 1A20706 TaxID=3160963 RepID=UPI003977584D